MPKREISRRRNTAGAPASFTKEQMLAQVRRDPSRECVAIDASPMLPPLMRCVGACGRCEELMAKYLATAPARERARQEYEAANPIKAAEAAHRDGPHVPTDDLEDDVDALPYIETPPLADELE